MGIFNHKVESDSNDPFKNDKLGRRQEVIILTNLFSIVGNQMVLAIDSPWGTGKTTFLNMWKKHLDLEGYSTIYYNSWENDFVEDPFISFMGEFKEQFESSLLSEEFKSSIRQLGVSLLKNGVTLGLSALKTKTGIDFNLLTEDDLKDLVDAKLEDYSKAKESVEKFKDELTKISNKYFKDTGKPMVIFVDELDRCRPDFAISLLERVKHLMNVENIIFVLGIDKDALSNSIKVIYGDGTDINGYLTRFIDLEYKLSQKYNDQYIESLLDKYNFKDIFNGQSTYRYDSFKSICKQTFNLFKFSLRDLEKIITRLYLIMSSNRDSWQFMIPLVFTLSLRHFDKIIYYRLMSGEIKVNDLMDLLKDRTEINSWFNNQESYGYIVDGYLTYVFEDTERFKFKDENATDINRLFIDAYNNAKSILMHHNTKKYLLERIDMYEFI